MQRSRAMIFAWILLLVPTLVVGALALRTVLFEQERLEQQDVKAALERLQGIADNLNLAVAEMREGMLESLSELPQQGRVDRLDRWQLENPLIRNVFVWEAGRGLVFPDPERPASDEEKEFVQRYAALFSERIPWEQPEQDPLPSSAAEKSYLSARSELRELSKSTPSAAVADAQESSMLQRGWRPWFWENRLYMLGWVTTADGRQRFGLEVEMMALLSRLLESLPAGGDNGELFALLDDRGEVIHQGRGVELQPGNVPYAVVPVGQGLPHWQVAVYHLAGEGEGRPGVVLFGTLLVATFMAAIFFGGGLMLWEARRHARDAGRKTSFVANVSHELKTPLTTIRMYTELLQENPEDEEKRSRYLEVIDSESQRLARLVNNVLDFGRLEQGRKNYRQEEFDVVDMLAGIVEREGRRIESAGLQMEVDLLPAPLLVRWDRDALEQVVLNLVDNALKYADTGKRLRLDVKESPATVLIRVCDRGPGVPENHRERIFDKFHRVDESLAARHPGSGLGLSIARQLLRDQGGELRYVPAQVGACFEVEIPRPGERV